MKLDFIDLRNEILYVGKRNQENNMVGTILAGDQIKDIGWFIQGNNYFMRSFHDKINIVPMGMNTKVQGRLPLSPMHNFSFTSLLKTF